MEDNKGWVIVMTAAGNYIGKSNLGNNPTVLELNPAFVWINEQVMVGPGQMAMMRQAVPLQGNLQASKLKINSWVAIQELDEWPDHSRDEVIRQINHVIEGLIADSARKSGIVTPQVSNNFVQDILKGKFK